VHRSSGSRIKDENSGESACHREKSGGTFKELIPLLAGQRVREARETGKVDYAPLMVGQSIGFIRDIPSCKELIERMAKEDKEHLACVNKMIPAA